jgi:O-antigen/teichoic acid export membrane protein
MKSLFRLLSVFVARGTSAIGNMLFSLAIARIGGPAVLGQATVFVGILGAGGTLASGGLDSLVLRAASRGSPTGKGASQTGILLVGLRRMAASSVFITLGGALLLGSGLFGESLPWSTVTFLVALPIVSAQALVAAYFKATDRAWMAPFFESGGYSLIAALLLFGAMAGLPIGPLPAIMLALVMLGMLAVAIVSRERTRETAGGESPEAALAGSQFDFVAIAFATFIVQSGAFTLAGPFLSHETLGLLRGAERFAVIVMFPMLAINPFIAPRIVRLTSLGDTAGLRRLTAKAVMVSAAAGLISLPFMLFAPSLVLSVMGPNFSGAAGHLQLLAVANFGIVALGPFPMILNMSGFERIAMWLNLTSLVVAVITYPLLSYLLGAGGFVAAYMIVTQSRSIAIAAACFLGPLAGKRIAARRRGEV